MTFFQRPKPSEVVVVLLSMLFLWIVVITMSGCNGERRTNAQLAANIYAAAEAAQAGADIDRTQSAIRLQAERIANLNGYTIAGAQAWTRSHQPSAPVNGLPMPSVPLITP